MAQYFSSFSMKFNNFLKKNSINTLSYTIKICQPQKKLIVKLVLEYSIRIIFQ